MILCKDCVWCNPKTRLFGGLDWDNAKCYNPKVYADDCDTKVNFVTGEIKGKVVTKRRAEKCNAVRARSSIKCTPQAKFFEPTTQSDIGAGDGL